MPTIGADFDPLQPIPAGGVLSGQHPTPSFADPPFSRATRAQLNQKSSLGHVHAASAVSSGQVATDRIPTSTEPSAFAVPRADDPRLSPSTPTTWDLYDDSTGNPFVGDAPKFDGQKYVPGTLPPGASILDAGIARKGAVTLAGDLRGTAAEPRVFRAAPVSGFQQLDQSLQQQDMSLAGHYFCVINVKNTQFSYDVMLWPVNMIDGQIGTIEYFAVGGTRTVGLINSITSIANVPRNISIPQNRSGVFRFFYSARTNRIMLFDIRVEP